MVEHSYIKYDTYLKMSKYLEKNPKIPGFFLSFPVCYISIQVLCIIKTSIERADVYVDSRQPYVVSAIQKKD